MDIGHNKGHNTYAEDRKGQVKRSLQASVSHAHEQRATLLRRGARARRRAMLACMHGRNELHARRGGERVRKL